MIYILGPSTCIFRDTVSYVMSSPKKKKKNVSYICDEKRGSKCFLG